MWDEWRSGLFAVLPARGMNLDLVWATAALVGAVFIGVVVIVWVDRWRKRSLTELQAPADELGHYRELFDQGLLSAEEYERIRRRLEKRPQAKPLAASASATPAQEPAVPPPLPNGPPANPGPH